ncbi:hypothetical protein EKH55_1453 [Sinorhizobium alkalisoli]|nr:hypothetical protein EKH55_1453 [Sinorhizobium alkalisoli]
MLPFNLKTCYPSGVGQEDVLAQHIRSVLVVHPPQGDVLARPFCSSQDRRNDRAHADG